MRNYHLRRNSKWCPAINLEQLYTLIPEETRQKYENNKEKAVVIDVVRKVIMISINFIIFSMNLSDEKLLFSDRRSEVQFLCCQYLI